MAQQPHPGLPGIKRDRKKKPEPKKANFLTLEETEAHRHREKHRDLVVNHKDESIGEHYHSIRDRLTGMIRRSDLSSSSNRITTST